MPHIHCYLDRGSLIWTMVITDALIGIAYLCISIILYLLVKKIKLPFQYIFLAFGLFIFACGGTHFIEIYNLWVPDYWLSAVVKAVTAVASIATAVALYFLKPKIVRFAEEGRNSSENNQRLSSAYHLLDSLIENLPNMVFVKDAKDLRFVRFNKAGEDLLGYSRNDLIGKNDFDFFTEEQASFFVEKDRAVLSGSGIVDIPHEEIQTKFKGTRILHTRKIPLTNKDGKPEYLLGISEDVTERVKSDLEHLKLNREQAALEERERANIRTAFLAETSTALASSLDFHVTLQKLSDLAVPRIADWCTITVMNESGAFERVASKHRDPKKAALLDELNLKYPATGEENKSTGFTILSGKSLLIEQITTESLEHAAIDERHLEIMKELGSYSCVLVPIPGREKVHGSIAFVSGESQRQYRKDDLDVFEELAKRAGIAIDNVMLYETAQKAIQIRDEFLSIASHELKTPITSLKLQLQLTRRTMETAPGSLPTPEKLEKVLSISITQVNRLTKLVEDLLDVSKIQAGKLSLEYEEVNLEAIVQGVRERFSEQLSETQCVLEINISKEIVGRWDRSRVEQVFDNLISNAIKYAPGKPLVVRATIENGQAVITVKDHGPGIPKDKHEAIFNRFERATGSRNISGLGLGLFIVRQIVSAQGGSIRVESEVGQGTSFIVTLPIR